MADEYGAQAEALFAGLTSGDDAAAWRFKWEHPRFRDQTIDAVRTATLNLTDAQCVVAREHGFEDWAHLREFARAVVDDPNVARFEAAVEAVVAGDVPTLRSMLQETPELARARSARRHHATLLHYIAANGVEGERQQTPPNAVAVARLLLDAGAEVDALADMYNAKCTTMSMLVSSSPPAKAGLQAALAETLLDYGATFQGPGTNWQSAVLTALAFGFLDTAQALVRRGAPVDTLPAAAGLGRLDDAARLLPDADPRSRHIALALAAQHGHTPIVKLLLDTGEDPNRYNPNGYHAHSTPLHQAVWSNHGDVVRLLVERGARLDVRDTVYRGTPLDWANYGHRTELAAFLRSAEA
jgi:ankyrin repeat protein